MRVQTKMKILVVAHESHFNGGANRALWALIKEWKKIDNLQIEVLLPDSKGEFAKELLKNEYEIEVSKYFKIFTESKNDGKDFFRYIKLYLKYFYNKIRILFLCSRIKSKNYDLIYSNTRMTSVGCELSKKLRIPHIMHVREFGNENTVWGPSSISNIYNNSSKIIVISKALQKHLAKEIKNDKFIVSYDGVSYKDDNAHTSFNENQINLILTGRIAPAKGQDEAIEAIKVLRDKGYSNIHLYFAGSAASNSESEKRYYNNLQNLISCNNLEEFITFTGEINDMKAFRSNMDIELMCAWRETFGWVTVEGMRSGLLVIGANTGATPEIITNNENGLIYQKNNPEDLADKIEWAINHKNDCNIIRKKAYVFSNNNYLVSTNAEEVYSAFVDSI